ncbi:MAG: hypothetical protein IPM29_00750 [Planctomycetes bacterium]|nr:hypothetical protein [Planctomycetota bacterium]
MAFPKTTSLVRRSRRGLRALSGLTGALCLLGLLASCGDGRTAAERARDEHVTRVRTAYHEQFQRLAPDFVVVTYGGAVTDLTPAKRDELNTVLDVLDSLGIPSKHGRRADLFETLQLGTPPQPYEAWVPDQDALTNHRNGLIVVLNLGLEHSIQMVVHQRAKEAGMRVKGWNDPLDRAEGGGRVAY